MRTILLIAMVLVAGCTSVTKITDQGQAHDYGDACQVTVYQTKDKALERGPIKELCVIEGTSAWSLNHTSQTAINKHAKKACECDANKVYVQSRAPMGAGPASVSMVAFEYVDVAQRHGEELAALTNLRDDGIITEEEFQKQKAAILNR